MPGQSGNPDGRPKDTMKQFLRKKLIDMTDDEKEEFIKTVSHEMQVKLAEGNPEQKSESELTHKGLDLVGLFDKAKELDE